ncbi:MAG: hypothetical protein E7604_14410 [Ruminococcaceae bacterium]|nr:hypothetical protein [Oscillospiraceae bacterium]
MTIRRFWKFSLICMGILSVTVICAITVGRHSTMPGRHLTEEERYIFEIESLTPQPYFSLRHKGTYPDYETLIKYGKPNLIVRVTLEERGDAAVYDPHGYYTTEMLGETNDEVQKLLDRQRDENPENETDDGHVYGWWGDAAYEHVQKIAYYISTPYTAHVEEVIHGDCLSVGDEFLFYAPYGIIGDFHIRYEDTPIYMAGREYILFFSVVDIEGVGRWYDLVHPSAAVEITLADTRTFSAMSRAGDAMFADTGWDCDTLKSLLSEYYTEYPYPIEIPVLPRMRP